MTAPSPPYAPPPPSWPTEPVKPTEAAGPRSQLAVFVVCAVAMGIMCAAVGELGWGIAGMLALAAGIAVGLLGNLGRFFRTIPGAVAAILTMMTLTVVIAFFGASVLAFSCVPLVGAFILGLDWDLVRRLRPLPFAFGFVVVMGMSGGESWTYPAGLVWLVLALGALALLEADRRAGQPQVEAVTGGPAGDDLRTGDLATTVLVALAIALVAALLLSTPSCQRSSNRANQSNGSSQSGSGRSGSGEFGSGENGSGQSGSGGNGTGSSGQGTASDHLYVPDPQGNFLIPNNGEAGSGSGDGGVPSPTLLPDAGEPIRSRTYDDGSSLTAERLPDGSGRIIVRDPEGAYRTYTYHERSDGLIEIRERNPDGSTGRTLYYDPKGRLATDDESAANKGLDPADPPAEKKDKAEESHLDGRLLALIAVILAALGGLIWWWTKRTPKAPPPEAPPWAVQLAREIDRAGAARGPARRRSQSLARYADDLAAGPLPDPRLPDVADVVSTALFARTDPGPEAQRWAEATWSEIAAAHPVPSRSEKRRARAGAGAPPG